MDKAVQCVLQQRAGMKTRTTQTVHIHGCTKVYHAIVNCGGDQSPIANCGPTASGRLAIVKEIKLSRSQKRRLRRRLQRQQLQLRAGP